MNKQRISFLIAAGVGALSTLLPWIKMPIVGTINGLKYDSGIIALLSFVAVIGVSMLNDVTKPIKGGLLLAVISPGILACIAGGVTVSEFKQKLADIGTDNIFAQGLAASASVELGLYLTIASGAALAVLPFVMNKKNDDTKPIEAEV